ncbi:hypothetical protein AGMMS49546_17380 [Spirochaetia bacterium]|nr:hypothetical protein AGMMS49546_17380 [Spirochaetia bacterium]
MTHNPGAAINSVDNFFYKLANNIALAFIVLFALFRTSVLLKEGDPREAVIVAICCAAAFLGVIALRAVRRTLNPALSVPLLIYIVFTAATVAMNSFAYFFPGCFTICCIGSIYFYPRKFLQYMMITNAANLALILLGIPLLDPLMELTRSDLIIDWVLLFSSSLCLYFFSKFATDYSREAAKDQDAFQTLLETTHDYIALLDKFNCITYISKSLAEFAHIEDRMLAVGQPVMDLFRTRELKDMVYRIITAEGFYEGTFNIGGDGQEQYLKIIADKLLGDTPGIFFSGDDVTPVVAAKLEAEHAAQAKSAFLANTSHEIRTPLSAILGMTELILRRDVSSDIYADAMSIKQAGESLLAIINDILDLSKIDSGKMELVAGEYYTASLIQDVVNIIRLRLGEKHIRFITNIDAHIPAKLYGDMVRIRQVLLNLLSNAVKYTEKGYIKFSCYSENSGEDVRMIFEVSDTGFGIKEEELDKIFGDFTRVDSRRNQNIEGTGLGLAISRNLCRLMGGDISVKSTYGEGSTFTAAIPQKRRGEEPLAVVENRETKEVLLYERRDIYQDSIIYSLKNLEVPFTVTSRDELFMELKKRPWSFVLVSPDVLDEVRQFVQREGLKTTVALLAKREEDELFQYIPTISIPAYTPLIANVLNGVREVKKAKKALAKFTAPDARVLIVDDISTNLNVVRGLLAPYKINISTATNGKEAIELVRAIRFDVVFMDHMMPEMDGIEATVAIRQMEGDYYRTLPIIALTANAVTGMKEMFLSRGFNDYLSKPIGIAKLDDMIAKWIPAEKKMAPSEDQLTAEAGEGMGPEAENQLAARYQLLIHLGMDIKNGIAQTGGTEAGYRKILASFRRDADERLPALEGFLKSLKGQGGDEKLLSAFTNNVHALKSAAATIKAVEVSKAAAELEAAGRAENRKLIEARLPGFCQELGALTVGIGLVLRGGAAGENSGEEKSDAIGQYIPLFRDLRSALENENIETIDRLIAELEDKSFDAKTGKIIENLSDQVLMTEFKEAMATIDELLNTSGA